MSDVNNKIPTQIEVRQIFNEAYNVFYKKWTNSITPHDPDQMLREAHELNRKYECELCRHMIADLIECIENEWRYKETK